MYIFPGSNISLLTKEELDKIFSDIDASLKQELNRKPPVKIKLIRTKETDNCEDICVANHSENDEILSRVGTDIKSRDKPIKRTLLKRIKKSLIILLQKLVFRKKTDYYKRMEAIKKQWVMFDFIYSQWKDNLNFVEGRNAARLEEGGELWDPDGIFFPGWQVSVEPGEERHCEKVRGVQQGGDWRHFSQNQCRVWHDCGHS